jgi:hypothetical protein
MGILIILGGIFIAVAWAVCIVKIVQIIWEYLFSKGRKINL